MKGLTAVPAARGDGGGARQAEIVGVWLGRRLMLLSSLYIDSNFRTDRLATSVGALVHPSSISYLAVLLGVDLSSKTDLGWLIVSYWLVLLPGVVLAEALSRLHTGI